MNECKYCGDVHKIDHTCFEKLRAEFPVLRKEVSSDQKDYLELLGRVTRLQAQLEQKKMFAYLWLTRAQTGEYKERVGKVSDGAGRKYTEEELLQDCLRIAQTHIHQYADWAETLVVLKKALVHAEITLKNK